MRITVPVDQAEALKRGVDAPSSTTVLDINPAEFSEFDRAVLARCLSDGHVLVARSSSWEEGKPETSVFLNPRISLPCVGGLREWLAVVASEVAQRRAETEAERRRELAASEKAARAALAKRATYTVHVEITRGGEILTDPWATRGVVRRSIEAPLAHTLTERERAGLPPELVAEVDAYNAQATATLEAKLAEETTRLRVELLNFLAREEAQAERLAEETRALDLRLPKDLRERMAEGVAPRREIEASRRQVVEDRLREAFRAAQETDTSTMVEVPDACVIDADRVELFGSEEWTFVKRCKALAKSAACEVQFVEAQVRADGTEEGEEGVAGSAFLAVFSLTFAGQTAKLYYFNQNTKGAA